MTMDMNSFALNRVGESGLPGHFASCPPAVGLLLYLRKAPGQPALEVAGSAGLRKTPFAATGAVCLPQRSKGGARRAGDMSEGGYTVPVAGSDTALMTLQATAQSTKPDSRIGDCECLPKY
jgi:hypothetical protein